jgi:cytoskeletal protein CcmA (bactofilin family)
MMPQGVLGYQGLKDFLTLTRDYEVYPEETYYIASGVVFATRDLRVDGALFIDGEVHCFGDVTGSGEIRGSGELRMEV